MKSLGHSLPARLLEPLARAVCRRPQWFLWSQIFLLGLCVWYTFRYLEFDSSRNNLVGEDKRYHHNFLEFKKEFPAQDDLVVVVESERPEKNRQFVERLGMKLEAETNLFTGVFYKGDLKMLGPKALLFVPEQDLEALRQTVDNYRPFIRQFANATNLASLFDLINGQISRARREDTPENRALIGAFPMLENIIRGATISLERPGLPPSPAITALFSSGPDAGQHIYITYDDARIFLVTARARTEALSGAAVERLRELVAQTQFEIPGLNAGITGEPVLEEDEMAQSQKDMTRATVVALILCALIFIYGYRETGRPVKATLCLIVGLGYTMAFTTATIGHLNILTITFVPILIGLAIDFGVHLITRYEEELRHGASEEAALVKAMVFTGQGIFTGALTTSAAFWAMALTDFKGIQEMGVICGGGILICLVPMMTMLPAMLLRGRQNVIDHTNHDPRWDHRARIEQIWLRRPVQVTLLTVALTGLALAQFPKVHFDYNLLNMQSEGLPSVEFEMKLINSASKSVIFAAVVADDLDEAQTLEASLSQLSTVTNVESMSRYLAEDPTRKLELIGEIKRTIAPIEFARPDTSPVDVRELSRTLWSLRGYLGLISTSVAEGEPALNEQLLSLQAAIDEIRRTMLSGNAEANAARLAVYQQALFHDIRETFEALRIQDNRTGMRIEDLPPALRNRFIGVNGRYLLQVYPVKDVWTRANQEEFISELRTVDPDVTGTPVQLYEYTTLLKESYQEAAWYALVAISLMVLIHFRSFVSLGFALLPVLLGSIWMGGLMGWLGIPFNPANIMTLPLVIGIGVTNGIHILNRFTEEQNPSILAKSTGKAVLVSGLTTIAGFGSLTLAQHQGIESLGYVMAVGVTTCMVAGLTFLPTLLNAGTLRKNIIPSADKTPTLGREEPRSKNLNQGRDGTLVDE